MRAPHGARQRATLQAVADGITTISLLARHTGWAAGVAEKALENGRGFKLLEHTGDKHDGDSIHRLTALGMQKLGAWRALSAAQQPDLGEQAMALILDTPAGMDSQVLAQELGVGATAVENALAPRVQAHELVACGVCKVVDGMNRGFVLYRESAGLGPRQHVPLLGTLDIDAVDRQQAAAEGREDPAQAFNCALWSNGHMVIRLRGQELRLEPKHTKLLTQYLRSVQVVTGPRDGGAA